MYKITVLSAGYGTGLYHIVFNFVVAHRFSNNRHYFPQKTPTKLAIENSPCLANFNVISVSQKLYSVSVSATLETVSSILMIFLHNFFVPRICAVDMAGTNQ